MANCGGVKEALEGQKRSDQSDEFLVKKKNPLQMPPDMNRLPKPGDDLEIKKSDNSEDVKELLKIKENNSSKQSSDDSNLLNEMLKKIE
ncbi:DUF3035 domain-containing protein [Candidatus Pelagibacter sp.]|nr:DUF3035 domain-containing protein [Candidatus Pelagibacter sp.]